MRYYGGSALYYCWPLVWLSAFHSNISHFCSTRIYRANREANLPFGSSLCKIHYEIIYDFAPPPWIFIALMRYIERSESERLASIIYVLPSGPGVLCRRIFHKRITSARWNGQRAPGLRQLCAPINLRTRSSIMARRMQWTRAAGALPHSRQYYTRSKYGFALLGDHIDLKTQYHTF